MGYLVRGDAVIVGEVQRQTIVPKTEVTPYLEGIGLLPEQIGIRIWESPIPTLPP